MTKGAESADVEDIMHRLGGVDVVGIMKAAVVAIITDKRTVRRMMKIWVVD